MRDDAPCCPEPVFPHGPVPMASQTVQPEWIDYNGHMNVAYYTLAFDRSLDDFLDNWMGTGAGFVERSRLGPMALQTQIFYLGELLEGERFHVEVMLLDCDAKRMHFIATMISERTGEPAATYECLQLLVNLETRRPASYPDWALARMHKLMEAQKDTPRPAQVGRPLGIRRES